MLAFAIRRLIEAAFVMLTVAFLAFVLFRFVGDPVNQMVGQDTPLEERIKWLCTAASIFDLIYQPGDAAPLDLNTIAAPEGEPEA